jgi:hypothetical protein
MGLHVVAPFFSGPQLLPDQPLLVLIQIAIRLKLALTNLRDFSGPVPEPHLS